MAVEGIGVLADRVVGDDGAGPAVGEEASEAVAVVGAIREADGRGGQRPEQRRGDPQVAELAGGDDEGDGPALAVDDGVDLGGAAAA